ncbi:MAG: UDP-N-acetylmuramyl tripeptide synthase [Candidatus Curtissbacteria bacterium GW2011_GWC2_38_9]|uniref:UDP-N-acetylmuramyl tripeptide synthase n=1 Tax=Candidatus Curtissbacteria bacterium GW2011_GWC2_38_9 TaxID=1618414 RepID=A0A0G0LF28_9BACT|nr:MAG: UDP-N-acetylmuramyl tripeptide synthase [Candidatus Curtissbacteria bacterium GW2011_GWC2_38_9]
MKPTISSHGENVIMDINSVRDLKIAIVTFLSKYNQSAYFLIEKQFEAKEYRIFVTQSGFIAAVERTPANITGDGKSTIRKLIKVENYRRMNPRNTCLCKIAIDDISKNHLKKQGLSFSATPTKGQKVFLRKNSNVSTGGNCYDVTDSMHLSYKKLAKAILNALNVPFVGIDLLCSDISKNMDDYKVCELNSAPGLSLHMMPEKGKSRDVANAIVDVIFPPVI